PDPTGFGFAKPVTSFTFDQMRFGTIGTFGSCDPRNVESTCLKRIATLFDPTRATPAMLLFAATRLIRSAALSCRPMVRLYSTSSAVSGLPSDHLTFGRTAIV